MRLQRNIISNVIMILLLTSMFSMLRIQSTAATLDSWPTFHHDISRTGYTSMSGPRAGNKLWSSPVGVCMSSPSVVEGLVYVCARDGSIYCLDASNGAIIWSYKIGGWVDSSPSVAGGKVYVSSDDNSYYCLDASNGAQIWKHSMPWNGGVSAAFSSPAVVGSCVYVGSEDGNVYCLDASNGSEIWSYPTGQVFVFSSPSVVGGSVYVGSFGAHEVYCLDASNGSEIWSYPTGSVDSSPSVVDGSVFVGSQDGNVYCLDASTGALVWSYPTGGWVESSPAVANGMVYVGSYDGKIYCLNAANGALIWNYTTGSSAFSSPAVAGDCVYVGSEDDSVYCFDATTGAPIWSYPTSGWVDSSPSIVGGKVYVGSYDGNVYCLAPQSATSVSCSLSPNPVSPDTWVTCTASVVGSNPTGTITWSTDSTTGVFTQSLCSLVSGTCSTTYKDTHVGSAVITATYSGDPNNTPSIGSAILTVSSPAFRVSISPPTATIDLGQSINFVSVIYDGTMPFIYQWFLNDAPVQVSTPGQWMFTPSNMGSYTVQLEVTDSTGTISSSNTARIQVIASITFEESGLPTGAEWSVTFNAQKQSSTSNQITFSATNGVYLFSITKLAGFTVSPPSGSIKVEGADTQQPITFSLDPSAISTRWDYYVDSYDVPNPYVSWANTAGCFGMTSTALMYFMQTTMGDNSYPYFPSQPPVAAAHTSDLNLEVKWHWYDPLHRLNPYLDTLNNASLAVMFHQVYLSSPFIPKWYNDPNLRRQQENQQFMYLLANLTAKQPVVLSLAVTSSRDGHAVVAFGAKPETDANGVPTGKVDIYIYDPNYPETYKTAKYDIIASSFSYNEDYAFDFFSVVNTSDLLPPLPINLTNYPAPIGNYAPYWLEASVTDYTIVIADARAKLVTLTDRNSGLTDSFTTLGDSRTFRKGISGSSGIEEGDVQVYAIPSDIHIDISDPGLGQSSMLIASVNNDSGQLDGYEYFLNVSTTQGILNFTATPSSSGLSIGAGDNALNATVTCFSATQQGYSVSDVLTAQIDAGQNVSLTAPCVASFTASKTVVGQGYPVPINVTITNSGDNPENVRLTLYANGTALDTETVFNLMNGTSVNLACSGNTSSCAYGNYTLSAYCEPNGINEAAINFTYVGVVKVTIPGDINGDFKVSLADLVLLANAYGSKPGNAKWNPNADIDGNGVLGLSDLVIMATHYGQHYP